MALSDGLVGYWSPWLGSSGYRLLDRTRYANHGSFNGMTVNDWVASSIRGRSGNVLDFDGVDNRVPVNFKPFLGPLTAACWIRRNGNPAAVEVPFSCSQDTGSFNQMFFISVETNGTIRYQGSSGGVVNNLISTTTIGTNQWRFVVGAGIFGTSFSLYVDGFLEGTKTGGGSNSITGVAGVIGAYNQAATFNRFTGQIAEACIFNRALGAAEVLDLFRLGPGWYRPYQKRGYGYAAAGFKAYWHRRETQLIGGGLR